MDKDYIITAITGEFPSNYPDSKKYKFMVEGYDNELSAFSKFPMTAGQTIFGHVDIVGQYHNFKWGKKSSTFQKGGTTPDANRLEAKIDAVLAGQQTIGATLTGMKGVMGDILSKLPKTDDEPPF